MKFETTAGSTTTVELVNGSTGHPVELDEDMNIVIRITDTSTQTIEVVTTMGSNSITRSFNLEGLTLLPEEDDINPIAQ